MPQSNYHIVIYCFEEAFLREPITFPLPLQTTESELLENVVHPDWLALAMNFINRHNKTQCIFSAKPAAASLRDTDLSDDASFVQRTVQAFLGHEQVIFEKGSNFFTELPYSWKQLLVHAVAHHNVRYPKDNLTVDNAEDLRRIIIVDGNASRIKQYRESFPSINIINPHELQINSGFSQAANLGTPVWLLSLMHLLDLAVPFQEEQIGTLNLLKCALLDYQRRCGLRRSLLGPTRVMSELSDYFHYLRYHSITGAQMSDPEQDKYSILTCLQRRSDRIQSDAVSWMPGSFFRHYLSRRPNGLSQDVTQPLKAHIQKP